MKRIATTMALTVFLIFAASAGPAEQVQWNVVERLDLDSEPKDVAVSIDGKSLYVLTEKGDILVYGSDGTYKDKINIGPHADSLKIGGSDDVLYVISRRNKTVETVQIDFIRNINTEGSPFRGPENAPVVIAVFSDFQ